MGGEGEGPAAREGDAERPGRQQEASCKGRESADRQTRPDQTCQSGAGTCSARKIGAVQEHNKYYFRRGPQKSQRRLGHRTTDSCDCGLG